MSDKVDIGQIIAAMERAIDRVLGLREELNELDAAMGDGDAGISATKAATGLKEFIAANPPPVSDIGAYFFNAGRAVNNAASSTLGTLIATALMRAGNEAKGLTDLDLNTMSKMLTAANSGIQERGKAQPGDKTIVDAMHPAAQAFATVVSERDDGKAAATAMLAAAREGRDAARALRSKMGRGAWVGERTENKLDPGTVLFVSVVEAIVEEPGANETE